MGLDISYAGLRDSNNSQGLVFDSEGVCIIAKYGDELSAYRARRGWTDILHNYFLLENERDYDFAISRPSDSSNFLLICSFTSACGRYAFWRLINEQAPDAEEQLSKTGQIARKDNKRQTSSFWTTSSNNNPVPLILAASQENYFPARKQLDKSSSKVAKFFRKFLV